MTMKFRFFPALKNFAELSDRNLRRWIAQSQEVAQKLAADPASYIAEARKDEASFSADDLVAEMTAGVEAIEKAKAELATREAEPVTDQLAELAARAAAESEPDPEPEPDTEPEPEAAPAEPVEELAEDTPELPAAEAPAAEASAEVEDEPVEPVVASLPPANHGGAVIVNETRLPVSLIASAEGLGKGLGSEIGSKRELAEMMSRRRAQIEGVSDGVFPVAQFQWGDGYPSSRRVGMDENDAVIVASALAEDEIREEMRRRKGLRDGDALVASGGLCAPFTPYYQLMTFGVTDRPVRAALPSFGADRGGLRYARPPALSSINTAVGIKTAANDAAGGTFAQKTCQVVDCPAWQDTPVDILWRCLQFGNLGARTFPERVANANDLAMTAFARMAEKALLDKIKAASTAVTAAHTTTLLGASADLLSQILVAGVAMRSRHRMDPDAPLRALFPDWTLEMLISDMQRGQFERFSMDEAGLIALIRSYDIEPTFYIDGSSDGQQIFGAQSAGALLNYPSTVEWYLYPEGSFVFLDGGTLELGLVRDSVLNKTNDYQVFGEQFESIAFVGVEALVITSTVCDSGVVAGPKSAAVCPAW